MVHPGTVIRASREGTLRPHGRRRPRDREPRHRQRQQPAKRPSPETETAAQAGYGSAEHDQKSLAETDANETQIRGRLAAARSEGTHPSAAVTTGKVTKARKSRSGVAVGAERSKNGLSR